MTQNANLAALSAAGVSVWLDDLSRQRLQSGNLQELIDTKSIVGVTTNPSIFQKALAEGEAYDAQIAELAERGADVEATIRTVTTDDVRNACDVLTHEWESSDGVDGRVSIEVDPRLAQDTDKTAKQAIELWKIVDRPNLFIKIPATKAGLPAISATLAEGISVNVTLIFSVERHREVMDAYLEGLEKAKQAGHDLSKIHSVASFFATGQDRLSRRAGAAWTGRRRQRPARVRGLPGSVRRRRSLRAAGGRRRSGAAAAVGVDRRQEPRLFRHALRHRAGRSPHREHHAGSDD
jgi:transaldolase